MFTLALLAATASTVDCSGGTAALGFCARDLAVVVARCDAPAIFLAAAVLALFFTFFVCASSGVFDFAGRAVRFAVFAVFAADLTAARAAPVFVTLFALLPAAARAVIFAALFAAVLAALRAGGAVVLAAPPRAAAAPALRAERNFFFVAAFAVLPPAREFATAGARASFAFAAVLFAAVPFAAVFGFARLFAESAEAGRETLFFPEGIRETLLAARFEDGHWLPGMSGEPLIAPRVETLNLG